jgi:hypothetical protein
MRVVLSFAVLATALSAAPTQVAAQDRAALIEEARNEFSDEVALNILFRVSNPQAPTTDSLWSVAVYDLAQVLIGQGEVAAAERWLRWVLRHGAAWPIDRDEYLPDVVSAYDRLRPTVTDDILPDPEARTTWEWPSSFEPGAQGRLSVRGTDPNAVAVEVVGRGNMDASGSMTLAPGTYELVISANGYESARVTRDVLPGATTALTLGLPPTFTAIGSASQWLALVERTSGGQRACGNGFFAASDGLVLTTMATVGNATGLGVSAFGGQETHADVPVTASDPSRNLAVLRLDGETGAMPGGSSPADGSWAWSVYREGCSDPLAARTRVAAWSRDADRPATLSTPLPDAAAGAPLVDRSGAVLGIVTDRNHVVPIALVEELLDQARADQVAVAGAGGGGMPTWLWIAIGGAAAAGAAVALGGGGGGGNGGGNGQTPPTTGGITITFPPGGL